jgi:hypothetical protein
MERRLGDERIRTDADILEDFMTNTTKIIGGKVTYGLTVCPKQYESKRADVELAFSVGEDDDYEAVFDRASRAVINRARQMCDLPKFEEPKPTVAPKTAIATPAQSTGLFGDS